MVEQIVVCPHCGSLALIEPNRFSPDSSSVSWPCRCGYDITADINPDGVVTNWSKIRQVRT